MYKLCIVVIVLLIVGIVCGQTSLAQINLEVQKLTEDVDDVRKPKLRVLKVSRNSHKEILL